MLFVNASPSTIADPAVLALRAEFPDRLVLELTEQEAVDDYDQLRQELARWLDRGVRLAIDDAGAGYSSLRHIVELSPDYLKLDRELVKGVDNDPNRRELMRAVVAFAREIGTSVIAEGVETQGELETLREAEVHLVQGYLLARPGPPWPAIERTEPSVSAHRSPTPTTRVADARQEVLRAKLALADNVLEACELAVEAVFRFGGLMASLYLQRDHELRCVAQRGLWQVLDGMPGTAGITGRTWATGQSIVVADVSTHPDYRVSVPGVVSEICVPIILDSDAVGSLNVESLSPLTPETVALTESVAHLLADRLAVIGTNVGNTRWQQAAHASVAISGLVANSRLPQNVLHPDHRGGRHGLGLPDPRPTGRPPGGRHRRAPVEVDDRAERRRTRRPVQPRRRYPIVLHRGRRIEPQFRGHRFVAGCRGPGRGDPAVVGPARAHRDHPAGPLPSAPSDR